MEISTAPTTEVHMRAKEALFKAGKISTIGRGRISADNHAWLKSEYDKGVRFSDWPKGEIQVTKSEDKPEKVTVKRDASQSGEKVVADIHYLYPEDEFVAVEMRDGKRVLRSMREACSNCRVSLVVCTCGSPRIVAVGKSVTGTVPVSIERK